MCKTTHQDYYLIYGISRISKGIKFVLWVCLVVIINLFTNLKKNLGGDIPTTVVT